MKGGQKLSTWQQEEANKLPPINCGVCNKGIPGAYGWTDFYTEVKASCSAKCEGVMAQLREKRHDAFPVRTTQANQSPDL
jgi:hypothetical protein